MSLDDDRTVGDDSSWDCETATVRVLYPKLLLSDNQPGTVQWLIGSPFSRLSPSSPIFDASISLLISIKNLVIGGLIVGDSDSEKSTLEAVRAARRLRTGNIHFFISKTEKLAKLEPVGSVVYEEDKSGMVACFTVPDDALGETK
ncbi:hypothetical protein Bca52824_000966 [Brassica carinata]|uniref:Uncharacterized protein n=1 Tax=Brassica carinata TaxID=52824 RepID=A0A8X7WHW2_BRACI|nr:hypothetical protein Bca52824_000966 [Brassica carinata]